MEKINLTRCGCGIDAHAHVVPENFPTCIGASVPPDWPSMAPAHECHRNVMISGKVYRTVSDKCWDTGKRLADMLEMGLGLQVVSPMPELLSYWMPADNGRQLARYLNDQIAAMSAESGGKILGLGAVPLQDIDLAIAELEYLMKTPGFVGVEIGSNINGVPVGSPSFDPFFEACESLGASVFVHAIRPAGMDRLVGPPALQQVLAYPGDVGLAAASVITGNLMVRRPRLRIAFSHGGGTLAMLLPRLQQGWHTFPALKEAVQAAPVEQARRLYYDTLVFDGPTLRHLSDTFGSSQLIVGTDYPFNFHDRTPVQRIQEAGFDTATAMQLIQHNAERFLDLKLEPQS
ncbi:MAG: amidohydrolase family protein [Pseudomonadota bacterium]